MTTQESPNTFSAEEARIPAMPLSADGLADNVLHADFKEPAAGVVTAAQESASEEIAQSEFRANVETFLDPKASPEVHDQLALMHEFWSKLGYTTPDPTVAQWDKFTTVLRDNPGKRVVPTPLLTFQQRQDVVESARVFRGNHLNPELAGLWVREENWMLASLLREPQHIERVGNASFSMRYRTINGELVDRETYVASLVAAGQAVVSEDEVVWTYPVMDVRVNSNRSNSRPEELFRKVNPVASPESLIATQLLHQAASTPTTRPSFDFANEAIFRRFDNQRDPTSPVVVACVFWDCNDCQVALDYQNTADRHPEFGVRSTVSGI